MVTLNAEQIADNRFQAVMLKGHLRLLSLGMKNSQFSGRQILTMAANLTQKEYKRGQYQQAIADLEEFLK